mgnify:CR=1 FL=1
MNKLFLSAIVSGAILLSGCSAMNSVQETNFSSSVLPTTNPATSDKKAEDPQDRFLKLLVTQMQNQDPLNPVDNAQVTSQIAQISTVTGIDKLNETLQLLVSDTELSKSMEAASIIGHNVLVPGKTITLEDGKALAGIDLPQSVEELEISILDSSGIAIGNIDLGHQATGVKTFVWDGTTDSGTPAANGAYNFAVTAKNDGKEVTVNPLALGAVSSV